MQTKSNIEEYAEYLNAYQHLASILGHDVMVRDDTVKEITTATSHQESMDALGRIANKWGVILPN